MRAREEERDEVKGLSLLFRHSLHLSTTDSSLLPSCSIFNFQPFLPRLFRYIFYPPKSFVLSFPPHLCHHFPSLPLLFHLPSYFQKTLLRDIHRQGFAATKRPEVFHFPWELAISSKHEWQRLGCGRAQRWDAWEFVATTNGSEDRGAPVSQVKGWVIDFIIWFISALIGYVHPVCVWD